MKVTFRIDHQGELALDADELSSGKTPKVALLSRNELAREQLAALRQRAVSSRASDEKEAVLIRARNEADQALYMATKLLASEYVANLSKDDASRISHQADVVEQAKLRGEAAPLARAARSLRSSVEAVVDQERR